MQKLKKVWYCILCFLLRNKKNLVISFSFGLIISISGACITKVYSDNIQSGIANSVIRFHVLANSDSKEDQQLKLLVRDNVLLDMKELLTQCQNKEDTKKILSENLERIKSVALKTIQDNGYSYPVHVLLSNDLFPYKEYGDTAFPSGYYDALRIEIGHADGRNWWCVMFPPMCFVDASCEEVSEESKNDLKNILSEEEYSVVVTSKSEQSFVPEVKLKVVEWWQEKQADESRYATKK